MSFEAHALLEPSRWVRRFATVIPPGQVLDLAAGRGRHVALLAGLGHEVLAADRDGDALAAVAGPGVATLTWDFETARNAWPFARGRFAGVVIANYLHRPLWPHILASLAPGGVLIVETFAQGNAEFGKPSNPDFLLAPGELLAAMQQHAPSGHAMRVLAYEDGHTTAPKPAMVQRICAVKVALGRAGTQLAPAQVSLDGWQALNKV
jgi:SAM-dependent methyltransferase